MLKFIRDVFAVRSTWILLLLSLFSIGLTVARIIFSESLFFVFLWWNLFLAFIPWSIAAFIRVRKVHNRLALAILLACWIVFFPNAPYILTDLIHLEPTWGAPLWYDLILLTSFAFTGMLYGFVSLHLLETRFFRRLSRFWSSVASAGLIYLSCFGIYLGRFLRWNSWDLVNNPRLVLSDVFARLSNPVEHRETWGFTILFGTLLNLVYWSYKTFAPAGAPSEPLRGVEPGGGGEP
jgi:uncharacterized membrane protein